jgi:hypothetical protein
MQSSAATVDEYLAGLPDDRRAVMTELRKAIKKSIPKGFKETMGLRQCGLGGAAFHVSGGVSLRPETALAVPGARFAEEPHSGLPHGIYASGDLLEWFQAEWPKHFFKELDMGESCISFKKSGGRSRCSDRRADLENDPAAMDRPLRMRLQVRREKRRSRLQKIARGETSGKRRIISAAVKPRHITYAIKPYCFVFPSRFLNQGSSPALARFHRHSGTFV